MESHDEMNQSREEDKLIHAKILFGKVYHDDDDRDHQDQ